MPVVGEEHEAKPVKQPMRFKIGLITIEGEEFEYQVVTWFGKEKAVALAVALHSKERPGKPIFEVTVDEQGTPALASKGYKLEGHE